MLQKKSFLILSSALIALSSSPMTAGEPTTQGKKQTPAQKWEAQMKAQKEEAEKSAAAKKGQNLKKETEYAKDKDFQDRVGLGETPYEHKKGTKWKRPEAPSKYTPEVKPKDNRSPHEQWKAKKEAQAAAKATEAKPQIAEERVVPMQAKQREAQRAEVEMPAPETKPEKKIETYMVEKMKLEPVAE